jgi:hypothetical protein
MRNLIPTLLRFLRAYPHVFAALCAVPLLLFSVIGFFWFWDPCTREVTDTIRSPNDTWVAVRVVSECGAMTRTIDFVNVYREGTHSLASENNVFVVRAGRSFRVSWKAANTLVIQCANCLVPDVEKKLEKLGPVQVHYQDFP